MLCYAFMQEALESSPRADRPGEAVLFRNLLTTVGFTDEGIRARLNLESLNDFVSLRKGRQNAADLAGPLDVAIRLFLDGDCVCDADLRRLLPEGLPEAMESLGVAARLDGGAWYGTVALYPVGPLYIASDRSSMPDGSPFVMRVDCVYPVAEQTQFFLETLPPLPCARLLDLGTGTGIAALAAARYATQAWAVDITERSARFADFNRVLNGIERVTVACGDLYAPVTGLTFDRIVAHPPYVPVGQSTYVYRDGGDDGEQVLRRIVEGLPEHLAPGGRFYGFGMASDREGEFFELRIRRWLGEAESEFDVLLVAWATVPPDSISSPLSDEERAHWARTFEICRVKYVFHGSIVVERHRAPRTGYTMRTHRGPHSGWRETEWLRRWMAACASGDAARIVLASRPKISERLEVRIVQKVRQGRLAVDECTLATAYPFEMECICQPWIAQAVAGCTGEATGREHFAEGVRRRVLPAESEEPDFARVLCGMVSGGFLELPEFPLPGPQEPE